MDCSHAGEDEEKMAGQDIMHIRCSPFASHFPYRHFLMTFY
jgi:hypothetical protein